MTFRRGARLDPGQVRDVRGQRSGRLGGLGGMLGGGGGGGGGSGIPIPAGGGIIGLIIVVVVLFLIFNGGLGGGTGTNPATNPGTSNYPIDDTRGDQTLAENCKTGADANARPDCAIVGYVNSIQAYWQKEFADSGQTYAIATTTLYTGSVDTGCGPASSDVGPFYCPADQNVYLDLTFFDELEARFGAEAAPLARAYVVAHEYGHHVQNLLGTLQRAQSGDTGPQSDAVRVELQADCYAGVWTANTVGTGYLEPITQPQVQQAVDAARAVGDDRIQRSSTGQVNPDRWTHGSSAQRQQWYTNGYQGGDPAANCDTFSGNV